MTSEMADVILGYDGSECSQVALDTAVDLAQRYGDRIVIAYADLPPDRLRGEEFKEHQRALKELGTEVTQEAQERIAVSGVESEIVFIANKPAAALVGLAAERDARFIVVGTHGEGPLTGAILGSVPHKLMQRSPVPVVVVNTSQ